MLMKKKTSQIYQTVPASAASLPEEQGVTKPVLSANDPEAEGLPEIMFIFNRFSQLPVNQTYGQREETQLRAPRCSPHHKKTNSYRSEHLLQQQRYSSKCRTPCNDQCKRITAHYLLKIFSKEVFPLSVSLLTEWLCCPTGPLQCNGKQDRLEKAPSHLILSHQFLGWLWCQPAHKQGSVIKKRGQKAINKVFRNCMPPWRDQKDLMI